MLCDHNTGQGHLRSSGKKGQTNKRPGYGTAIHVFMSNFRKKNTKNDPINCFEKSKSVKNKNRKIKGKWENLADFNMFHVITHPFVKLSS